MADLGAPEGWIWYCGACGKTSPTHYGIDNKNGWDESCMMNSFLIEVEVLKATEERPVLTPWHIGFMTKASSSLFGSRPSEFLLEAVALTKEAGENICKILQSTTSLFKYELREVISGKTDHAK